MTDPGDPKPDLPERAPARPAWLLWLIPMAVLVGIVWFVLRGDRSAEAVPDGGAVTSEVPAAQ
jgi:cytochrome c-type biogenesis protein CcmH/NrfF